MAREIIARSRLAAVRPASNDPMRLELRGADWVPDIGMSECVASGEPRPPDPRPCEYRDGESGPRLLSPL